MKPLTIGQLAKQAGVNIETIRYYERRNLIPKPPRRESGYRQYSPDYVRRLRFIKQAQAIGFSLPEIADILALGIESETSHNEIKKQTGAWITDMEAKLQRLHRMKQALNEVVNACGEGGQTGIDPILDALVKDSGC